MNPPVRVSSTFYTFGLEDYTFSEESPTVYTELILFSETKILQ